MSTLLIAEHDGASLNGATARALSAALAIGSDVHVLVAGLNVEGAAEHAAKLAGVKKVLLADDGAFAHDLAEPIATLIVSLASEYSSIVAPATSRFKSAMPRVAALLDVMQISEVMKVLAPDTFERPIYAGNVVQTVRVKDSKRILTVRTSAFAAAAIGDSAPIERISGHGAAVLSNVVREDMVVRERPELASAKIVVSGGRALKSKEEFTAYIEPLADRLGAAIGASRAAVDAGIAPSDWQVGQTGKIVAPELYIAIGISGAIQHLAGMKDSKVIVAINKDEEAPIFQIADYGIVGDLHDVVPKMMSRIAEPQ